MAAEWIDVTHALPKYSGYYLVSHTKFDGSISNRFYYNANTNKWRIIKDSDEVTLLSGYWWDEYSHIEKKTFKIKF